MESTTEGSGGECACDVCASVCYVTVHVLGEEECVCVT